MSAVVAFKSAANDSNYVVDQTQATGLFGEYMLMELVLEVARDLVRRGIWEGRLVPEGD